MESQYKSALSPPIYCSSNCGIVQSGQINGEQKRELIIATKKRPIRKRKRPEFKFVSYIVEPTYYLKQDKKFFLRGELIIDMDFIRENFRNSEGPSQSEFRVPNSVLFHKESRFFEVNLSKQQIYLKDFSFLIQMFNSLGDSDCHKVALLLEDYQKFFEKFDKQKEISSDIVFGETPLHSYRKSLINSIPYDEFWTYEKSCQRAQEIISNVLMTDPFGFLKIFLVVKGDGTVEKFLISELATKLFYGNTTVEEQTRSFLTNRQVIAEPNIFDLIDLKLALFSFYLNILLDESTSNQSYQTNHTENMGLKNGGFVKAGLEVKRTPLSNYASPKQNDYLLIFSVSPSSPVPVPQITKKPKEIVPKESESGLEYNIQYTIMSEHLIEKYYGGLDKEVNIVPSKFERILEKNNSIKDLKDSEQKNGIKTCGIKTIEQIYCEEESFQIADDFTSS